MKPDVCALSDADIKKFTKTVDAQSPLLLVLSSDPKDTVPFLSKVPDLGAGLVNAFKRFCGKGGSVSWYIDKQPDAAQAVYNKDYIRWNTLRVRRVSRFVSVTAHELCHEEQSNQGLLFFPQGRMEAFLEKKHTESAASAVQNIVLLALFARAMRKSRIRARTKTDRNRLFDIFIGNEGRGDFKQEADKTALRAFIVEHTGPWQLQKQDYLNCARHVFDAGMREKNGYAFKRAYQSLSTYQDYAAKMAGTFLGAGVSVVPAAIWVAAGGAPALQLAFTAAAVMGVDFFGAKHTTLVQRFAHMPQDGPALSAQDTQDRLVRLGDLRWMGVDGNFMTDTDGPSLRDTDFYASLTGSAAAPYIRPVARTARWFAPLQRIGELACRAPMPRV